MYNLKVYSNLGMWHAFCRTVEWQNDAPTQHIRTQISITRLNEELKNYNGHYVHEVPAFIRFDTEEDCVLFKLKFS